MDALGGSTHEVQELVADPDERAASAAAREAAGALAEAAAHPSAEQLAGVPFPHPELGDDEWHEQGEAFGSFKDELTEVCKPRGYRYQGRLGGRGIWVLTKRTKLHNQVAIKVDRGPIGGHAKAWLVLQGPLWSHTIHLPASRTTRELRVWNPATTRKLAGNFAAAARNSVRRRSSPRTKPFFKRPSALVTRSINSDRTGTAFSAAPVGVGARKSDA